ncbi:3-oxoadipate enol-lactonase 2 [Gemmata sp. SH-PL17]|uniref:alpha/beta fold hydrolase n=1 Tax=Gemmata sp. SH-PL17 TaxID=1630693 RepID=UPI0004B5C1D4|nr:alpha/beta fold hydrolase [Gemmata sp. SH-PL17]AMV22904.1 3-oxoadipate enol-lactonase 2 [Gemmata sp. SH-PL17]
MPVCTLPGGQTIGYDDAGSGPPLVLVHAFPFDRTMWAPQLAALAASARVLTLDVPGFGESPAAPELTIDGVAKTVSDFLAALNIPKAIVGGLSMGGYVALAFARNFADKLNGLILADTRAGVDDTNARANRTKSIALVNEKGSAALFESMVPKVLSDSTREVKPEVVERAKSIAARQPASSVAAALAALRDRPDANPGLKAITVPTLILVGEFDAVTPPLSSANLAAQIRGSKLVHIPGAGHLSNIENPDSFNNAVRVFLGERPV